MAEEIKPIVTTLPNGMRVVVLENRSAPVVSLQAWVRVGSADEPDDMAGVSHLLEHMLFKGTEKRKVGEIAREIEASGGYINAFTTYDATVYYVTIASRFFETGLEVLSDAIQNSAFDPVELEKEKEVVIEEIKRSEDIPERRAMNDLFALAYKVHPYRRPIIGYADQVRNITRERLVEYYRKWYSPQNITFVVTGDVGAQEALQKVERFFSNFKRGTLMPAGRVEEPEQKEIRVKISKEDVFETQLVLAFHIPGVYHKDTYALDILSSLLGEGDSSILYREVKHKRELVNSIYSYTYTPKDTGVFIIGASLESRNLERALVSIWEEINRLISREISYDDLQRARIKIESDFIYQKETVQGIARQLGYFDAIIGDLDYEKKYLEGIRRVTQEDIKLMIRKYLIPENLSVVVLGPKDISIEEEKIKQIFSTEHPKVTSSDSEIKKILLDNGIKLIVKSTPGTETISIYTASLGGVRYETEDTSGLTNLLSKVWTRGTKTRNADEIAEEIEEIGGEVSGYSGRNTFGLSQQFLSRFFERGIELFVDILINASFPEEEVEKVKREVLNELKNQMDDPGRIAFKLFYKKLYGDHPYGMDILGTPESVRGLTRKQVLKFYEKFVRPDNLVITLVGDFNVNNALKLLEEKLGKIKKSKTAHPKVSSVKELKEIRRGEKTIKAKEQAHIILGYLGTTIQSEDRYPLQVLEAILSGQGGRLFVKLRDEMSLAYDLRALSVEGIDPGYFALYIASSAEKENIAIDSLMKEIKKVLDQGVSEEEVERAKRYIIGNYEISLQSNSAQASTIAMNEIYGLGYDFHKKYPDRISSITAEIVNNVARKYLSPDRYVLAIVKPGKEK